MTYLIKQLKIEHAAQSSHPREFHPQVLTEPYVKVSLHTALPVQSQMYFYIMDIPIILAVIVFQIK